MAAEAATAVVEPSDEFFSALTSEDLKRSHGRLSGDDMDECQPSEKKQKCPPFNARESHHSWHAGLTGVSARDQQHAPRSFSPLRTGNASTLHGSNLRSLGRLSLDPEGPCSDASAESHDPAAPLHTEMKRLMRCGSLTKEHRALLKSSETAQQINISRRARSLSYTSGEEYDFLMDLDSNDDKLTALLVDRLKRRSMCEVEETPFIDALPSPLIKTSGTRPRRLSDKDQQPLPSSPLSRLSCSEPTTTRD
mmetsp:Transcript_14516/g.27884  ORF Transcript_14516/g.27884 Transcript_14516/m.27884 type:complete len:251 (-) Transcript_14516:227-979(-)